jgi:hypothetical protein
MVSGGADDFAPDSLDDRGGHQIGHGGVRIGDGAVFGDLEAVVGEAVEPAVERGVELEHGEPVAGQAGQAAVDLGWIGGEARGAEAAAGRRPGPGSDRVTGDGEGIEGEAVEAERGVRPLRLDSGGGPVDGGLEQTGHRPVPVEGRVGMVCDRAARVVAAEADDVAVEIGGVEDEAEVLAAGELGLDRGDVGGRDGAAHQGEQVGPVDHRDIVEVDCGAKQVEQGERLADRVAAAGGRVVTDEGGERPVGDALVGGALAGAVAAHLALVFDARHLEGVHHVLAPAVGEAVRVGVDEGRGWRPRAGRGRRRRRLRWRRVRARRP